jgi:hypothetical protein
MNHSHRAVESALRPCSYALHVMPVAELPCFTTRHLRAGSNLHVIITLDENARSKCAMAENSVNDETICDLS